jgi:hypothetical protein
MKILARNENYIVFSRDEDLWIAKTNSVDNKQSIGRFVGGPNCALISEDDRYLVVAGYGILLVDINKVFDNYNNETLGKLYFRRGNRRYWISKIWENESCGDFTFYFDSQLMQYCFYFKNNVLFESNGEKIAADEINVSLGVV